MSPRGTEGERSLSRLNRLLDGHCTANLTKGVAGCLVVGVIDGEFPSDIIGDIFRCSVAG